MTEPQAVPAPRPEDGPGEDEAARRKTKRIWIVVIILALLAVAAIPCIAGLVAAVSLGVPQVQDRQKRLTCLENLGGVGRVYVEWTFGLDSKTHKGGDALFREFAANGLLPAEFLVCPGDPDATGCSYAVRDFERFPLDPDSNELQIIACDRLGADGRTSHHMDGLCVLWHNGAFKFLDRAALGLGPTEEIVVGPESTHPKLQKVIHRGD